MRLRDATRSKVNLALLKFASETNCRWLNRLGISPANYLKQVQLSADMITAASMPEHGALNETSSRLRSGANPAINLSTD